ncbi:hypothetical protein RhiirC2_720434 [Rhizophagus irregularis]|uniref:Uncharacterized protein n=1 Tax=Rhizophagus irregularis TaxID=588596 RepID=A0A2N1MA91_9GLOM|nr:hypothetical protein RhiirC2_720434 [Rhizophagus irregularis]
MMETIYKLAMKKELGSSLKIKGFGTNDKYIFKGSDTNGHVTPDEVLDVINDFRKKGKTGEVPISEEDMILYNKVNQACSSRLPEIEKEEIPEEKIGHKFLDRYFIRRCMSSKLCNNCYNNR